MKKLHSKIAAHKVEIENLADSTPSEEDSMDSKGETIVKRDKSIPKPIHHLKHILRIFREENLRILVDETKYLDIVKIKKTLGNVNGVGLRTTI